MSQRKRFLSGMASGVGGIFIKTCLNLFLLPIIIYFLGQEQYGLFVLLVGLLELFHMLDLGFTSGVTKLLASYRALQDDAQANHLLRIANVFYTVMVVLVFLLGQSCIPGLVGFFHLSSPALVDVAQLCLTIVLLEGVLTLYTSYFQAVLLAHTLNQWTNVSEMLYSIVGNGVGVLLLANGFGLPGLMCARLGAGVVRTVLLLFQARKVEPGIFQWRASVEFHTLRELFSLSTHAMLRNLSIAISHKIDNFVIAGALPVASVGVYEIVFRFLSVTAQVLFKISEGIFPVFTRMVTLGQTPEARQFFLRISCFNNMVVSTLLMLIVCLYPETFHFFSAGKIPMEPTLPILAVAVPCIWSGALQAPASAYLFTSGRHRFLSASSLVTALTNLVLSLIFVRTFGLVGVALGTLIPQFIQHQFSLITTARRDLGIGFQEYARQVHLNVLLPLGVCYLWIQLCHPLVGPIVGWKLPILIPLGLIALSTVALGGVLWFALTATPLEKALLEEKILLPLKRRLRPAKVPS